MTEGEREYNVYLAAKITDEILVEAKNRDEAADIGKELFLLNLTGEQAKELIDENLEAEKVEEAL